MKKISLFNVLLFAAAILFAGASLTSCGSGDDNKSNPEDNNGQSSNSDGGSDGLRGYWIQNTWDEYQFETNVAPGWVWTHVNGLKTYLIYLDGEGGGTIYTEVTTPDQVENNREYAFRFCINHDESKTFTDNSWTTRPTNEVYNAYYNYGNDFRFYLNEQSRVTLIFDAREFDSQTRTGAKYEVITEPIGSTKELRSLTLLDNPTKTDYIAGEKVDLSGMTLVALYSDRTNEFVDYCHQYL